MQKSVAAAGHERPAEVKQPERPPLLQVLGPGLITGASDDDPSGIATYSQAGAQFGYNLGWTLLFTWPLMCAIQEISARIGRVTGHGLAGNLKRHYPWPIVLGLTGLLLIANTINLAADLGAMGAAVRLLIGGPQFVWVAAFTIVSALMEIFLRYARYVGVLKWLTVSLFAYVAVAFAVRTPWATVGYHLVVPAMSLKAGYLTVVVAVLGTTISPYLFFWQASSEVDETRETPEREPLLRAPEQAMPAFERIRLDTYLGMFFSNAVALFIIIATAATLHAHGVNNIQTSSDAARALRPIAGNLAFLVFAMGIVGCGLLAVPVLAGSAAYAIGEMMGWRSSLAAKPTRARGFYLTIAGLFAAGLVLNLVRLDPVKALFWSAVVNGVVAVPVMVMIMHLASRGSAMGAFRLRPRLKIMGWLATAAMAAAAAGMFATM
ncbi:MAG TPA: divalent metal cation transporter [Caulobacteraceae bacterium]|nr:divalent metal cation transporter [Caulobacteraceae bacterium]